jgi:hypothetical protein
MPHQTRVLSRTIVVLGSGVPGSLGALGGAKREIPKGASDRYPLPRACRCGEGVQHPHVGDRIRSRETRRLLL